MAARIGRLGWRFGLSLVAMLAVAGGVAYAAIPDTGTSTYHACMLKNVGTIRIIDPSLPTSSLLQHCNANLETQITFNQNGPKGDAGPPGAVGPPGPQGAPGPNEVADGAPCSIPGVTNGVLRITTNTDATLTMRCVDPAAEGDPIPVISLANPGLLTTGDLVTVAAALISHPIATDIRVQVQSSDPNVLSVVADATIPAGHTSSNIIGLPKQANTNVTLTVTFQLGGPGGETIQVPVRTGPF